MAEIPFGDVWVSVDDALPSEEGSYEVLVAPGAWGGSPTEPVLAEFKLPGAWYFGDIPEDWLDDSGASHAELAAEWRVTHWRHPRPT